MNIITTLAGVEVGQHWYWSIGGSNVHGQVLLSSWIVITLIASAVFLGASQLRLSKPQNGQILFESLVDFLSPTVASIFGPTG